MQNSERTQNLHFYQTPKHNNVKGENCSPQIVEESGISGETERAISCGENRGTVVRRIRVWQET